MKRLLLRVAGLMVVFGALSVATARADSHFSIYVGVVAPVVVAPPGYYVGYRWYPGAWVARRPVYAAPRYPHGYGRARAYRR